MESVARQIRGISCPLSPRSLIRVRLVGKKNRGMGPLGGAAPPFTSSKMSGKKGGRGAKGGTSASGIVPV